jgi:CHAD domain-containing protein
MAKSAYDIAPDATFIEAAHTSIRQQLHEMMSQLEGTRQGDDIEALHDMRVASRRLRAALSVFAAAFPPKPFTAIEKEVAKTTDALGAVRDGDVQIEFMQAAIDAAPESEKVGLKAFLAHLEQERDRERVLLVKELNRLEKSAFLKDFHKLLGDELKDDSKKDYSKEAHHG